MMSNVLHFVFKHKLLLLIILIGFILRFYNLSGIPISLNHDETAIGYNAYSIFKTGADEYGKFLPLSLKSFGDWKLPIYPFVDILPIAIFGLNEFAVRLPSAIAGLLAIPLIFIISNQIFKNRQIALLAALFLAVSPWGIFFSRIAYETNLATTLFLAGLVFYLKVYLESGDRKWLFATAFLWGLTIFTYHAFVIFTPLFFVVSFIFLVRKLKTIKESHILVGCVIFASFVLLSIVSTLTSGSLNKLSSTSLFDDQHLLSERVNVFRGDASFENSLIAKALHNKYAAVIYQIGQNYTASYSPAFLFDKGGEKFLHNIGTFGNFYLFDALFLAIGFATIFTGKRKGLWILIAWFLLGPIPSAITSDAPSSTRLYLMLPAFLLVSSFGAYMLFQYIINFKNLFSLTMIAFLIILFILNFIYFVDAYFVHMNYHRAQFFHYGYKEAVELANKYPDYEVEMYDPTNFPYISFLFYNKYDPVKFRESVVYYPDNYGPFYYVKSFDRYRFVDNIDYENLKEKVLYIDYRGIRDEDYKIIDPSGNPVFKYFFKD